MVNEIDGYKAPTESQSSRPLPACEVKEIEGPEPTLAGNLIHPPGFGVLPVSHHARFVPFLIHLGDDPQKVANNLQVRRAVQRQVHGAEHAAAGPQMQADAERKHELIGQVLPTGTPAARYSRASRRACMATSSALTPNWPKAGEDLGDVLGLQLDHDDVARPAGALHFFDGEAAFVPAGLLGDGPALAARRCAAASWPPRRGLGGR